MLHALSPRDAGKLAFVTQTTLSVDDTAEIVAALQARFPGDRRPAQGRHLLRHDQPAGGGQGHRRQGRAADRGRRAEFVEFACGSSKWPSAPAARRRCWCSAARTIRLDDFAGVRTLGITAGASAPEVAGRRGDRGFRDALRRHRRRGGDARRARRLQCAARAARSRTRGSDMAVYTEVSDDDLARFVARYGLGRLLSYKGIAEGVENTNYLVHTDTGPYILTLYEKRVETRDLPFFLGLMEHLAARGFNCPVPVRDGQRPDARRIGRAAGRDRHVSRRRVAIASRAACIAAPSASAGQAASGRRRLRAHAAERAGARRLGAALFDKLRGASRPDRAGPCARRSPPNSRIWSALAAAICPQGVIHADLFQDNVFFLGDQLSGRDRLLFRLQRRARLRRRHLPQRLVLRRRRHVQRDQGAALLRGYQRVRPLDAAERRACRCSRAARRCASC